MLKVLTEAKVSAWTSAGAVVVSAKPARFMGVSFLGSANATTLTIIDGVNTGGRTIGIVPVGAAAATFMPCTPLVCTAGIVTTNAGTMAGYAVFYK